MWKDQFEEMNHLFDRFFDSDFAAEKKKVEKAKKIEVK